MSRDSDIKRAKDRLLEGVGAPVSTSFHIDGFQQKAIELIY